MTPIQAGQAVSEVITNAIREAEAVIGRPLNDTERTAAIDDLVGVLTENAAKCPVSGKFLPNGNDRHDGKPTTIKEIIGSSDDSEVEPKTVTNCDSMAMNDAHEASKQALMGSVDHDECQPHALGAVGFSKAGDHAGAAKSHVAAAKAHEKLATAARKDDDEGMAMQHDRHASAHRRAASIHSATENTLNTFTQEDDPVLIVNEQSAEDKAMFAHLEEGGKYKASEANKASKKADKKGTAESHKAASKAHMEAAAHQTAAGKHDAAKEHKQKAAGHDKAAKSAKPTKNERTPMTYTKQQAIALLTANCACETKDREVLNTLSEATLNRLAANAAKKDKSSEDDSETEPTDNEEKPPFNPGMMGDKADNKSVKNSATSPEDREALAYAHRIVKNHRLKIVQTLVANVADDKERQALGNEYLKLPTPLLERMFNAVPKRQRQPNEEPVVNEYSDEPVGNFMGAGDLPPVFNGTLTTNGADDDQDNCLPYRQMD